MLYTREWVEEKYNYYNNLIWRGELPSFSDIELTINKTKKRWGCAGCSTWGRDNEGIPYAKHPILKLSNYFDAPEWAKLNTLVHEMCHLYEFFCAPQFILQAFRLNRYTNHYPKHGHGTIFYEQAKRVEEICGIEITRFVSQERLASAFLSDNIRSKAQGKIEKNNGIDIMLLLTADMRNGKQVSSLAYSKPNANALSEWKDFCTKRVDLAKKYFKAVALCKAFNPEVERIPLSRKINWYYMGSDLNDFIEKYGITVNDIILGNKSDFGNLDTKGNAVESMPQEKRYRLFTLKFTSGKVLKYTNVTKTEVEQRLREEFPKWPNATINKFAKNDELYMERKTHVDSLDMLVERVVKQGLRKHMQEKPEIEPFSDEEMSNLSGFVVVD